MDRLAQRQYLLPLEMRPDIPDHQYTNQLDQIIDEDMVPEWLDPEDRGLYHVTTNYPAVIQNGLQSRRQLQRSKTPTLGLGGNMPNENLEMVATTYSDNRAHMIEQDLKVTYHGASPVASSDGVSDRLSSFAQTPEGLFLLQ